MTRSMPVPLTCVVALDVLSPLVESVSAAPSLAHPVAHSGAAGSKAVSVGTLAVLTIEPVAPAFTFTLIVAVVDSPGANDPVFVHSTSGDVKVHVKPLVALEVMWSTLVVSSVSVSVIGPSAVALPLLVKLTV